MRRRRVAATAKGCVPNETRRWLVELTADARHRAAPQPRREPTRPVLYRNGVSARFGSVTAVEFGFLAGIAPQAMERLWSLAAATSGNRWQMGTPRKRPKQAKTVATGCDQLPIGDGKEGVDGSSPSEGFVKASCTGPSVGGSGDASERRRPRNVHRSEIQRLIGGASALGERDSGVDRGVRQASTRRSLLRRRRGERLRGRVRRGRGGRSGGRSSRGWRP